jgi:class 3 adenylate cyclase
VQEIGDFLEKLGMPEYGERFAENDIDASVLPHLTDQSLKELGVSLGHRLKILAAIKELSGPTPAAPGPAVAPAEPKPQDTAERRQVTVLFSDLVGSTALSARMDPEDLREIISAYQRCVAETVDRFGGFVAKYMGDGVLVYFGYPRANFGTLSLHEGEGVFRSVAMHNAPPAVVELRRRQPLMRPIGLVRMVETKEWFQVADAMEQQPDKRDDPDAAAFVELFRGTKPDRGANAQVC